jgi:HEPN domain-containing protein
VDLVAAFLATAADDLDAARACLDAGFPAACAFLAQQAAEKAVKAWLVGRGVHVGHTHYTSPVFLRAARRAGLDPRAVAADVHDLEEYAAGARYPTRVFPAGFEPPSAVIGGDEAREALGKARRVLAALRSGHPGMEAGSRAAPT